MKSDKNKLYNYINNFMLIFLIVFLGFGLLFSDGVKNAINFIFNGWRYSYLIPFIWLYIVLILFLIYIYSKIQYVNSKKLVIIIFCIALTPRIILAFLTKYTPTSDFLNYFSFGHLFLEKNFDAIKQICSNYNIPSFGGLAVINGVLASMFSPTIFGFHLANSIITSLIAVVIHLLGSIYNKRVGIIASFLYALYPASIIGTQVITNQHIATLFYLSAIYLLIISYESKKNALVSVCSGIFFIIGYFCHPSFATHIIAIIIYSLLIVFRNIKDKEYVKNIIKCVLLFSISSLLVYGISMQLLVATNIIEKDATQITMLSKVVVGLNQETQGQYSEEDYNRVIGKTIDEQNKIAIDLIKERTKNLKSLTNLVLDKVDYMWYQGDSIFYWYKIGEEQGIKELGINQNNINLENRVKVIDSYSQLDLIYCMSIYFLAFIGIMFNYSNYRFEKIYLLLWILSGWIGVHAFIEVQSRYRYFAMPIIFILSSIGLIKLVELLKRLYKRIKLQEKNSI